MHTDLLIIGGYWLFSALIGGMPEPCPTSRTAYRWAYGSLHILAGNVSNAVQSRYKALGAVAEALPPDSVIEHREATTVITAPQPKP